MNNFSAIIYLAVLLGTVPVLANQPELPGVCVEGAKLYPLAVGEHIFEEEQYQWGELPAGFDQNIAIRTELNLGQPLTIHVDRPGEIFAVLWKWDFGFLGHLPDGAKKELHGWNQVEGISGKIRGAGEPFSPISLYSRLLGEGVHELELLEYFGQWVIVGFTPFPSEEQPTVSPSQVTLDAARTRHNVYRPNATVTIESDQRILETAIYQRGERLNPITNQSFPAPSLRDGIVCGLTSIARPAGYR